jgi:rhodanese-related sulfurtransferase
MSATTRRDYRAIVPIEGYVHKFRLEAREEAAANIAELASAAPSASLGSVLGKFLLVALILLSLVASFARAQSVGPQAAEAKDHSKTAILTRTQFDALLARPEQLLVIDVRRPDEVTAIGGLPVYLSVQLADLEKYTAWIPKDRKIVTISNHAGRAGRAGDLLTARGFDVVGRIGVQNYEAEGGKLTKIAPKTSAGAQQSAQVK